MKQYRWLTPFLTAIIISPAIADSALENAYRKTCNPDATRAAGALAQQALSKGDLSGIQREMLKLQDCRQAREVLAPGMPD
jgi:hypothetical protein